MAHGDMLESSISRGTEGTASQRGFSLADLPAEVGPLLSTECFCDPFFTMFRGTLPVLCEDIHTSSNTKASTLNVIKM